jgi:proteic killer suppression protein
MIVSFADVDTERFYGLESVSRFAAFERQALRKLSILDAATDLRDLRSPPGDRLEALKGPRKGQHSIRINDRWRVCFKWANGNAEDGEIVDYQ